jgi:hypothetical protein
VFLSYLLETATAATSVLFVFSASTHIRRPGQFVSAVTNHDVVPFAHVAWTARWFTRAQLVLGASTAAVLLLRPGQRAIASLPALGLACACMSMAAYVTLAARKHPGASCGCFGGGGRVGRVAVVRAGLLGLSPLLFAATMYASSWQSLLACATIYLLCLGGLAITAVGRVKQATPSEFEFA